MIIEKAWVLTFGVWAFDIVIELSLLTDDREYEIVCRDWSVNKPGDTLRTWLLAVINDQGTLKPIEYLEMKFVSMSD